MILKAVLVLTAVLGTACAQTTNMENTNTPENITTPTPAVVQNEKENECRICDFDFKEYKGELNKAEVDGLLLALNDEYLATAIYEGVNKKFNDPRPFVNIVKAEMRHTEQLVGLFNKYKIPVPENPWTGKAPEYESVQAACVAGVEAEVINRDLYTRLFKTTEREDILFVYKNLQRASEENHKPAFERCSSGGGGKGFGPGRGRGRNN